MHLANCYFLETVMYNCLRLFLSDAKYTSNSKGFQNICKNLPFSYIPGAAKLQESNMKTFFKNIFLNGINAVITTQCLDLLFHW